MWSSHRSGLPAGAAGGGLRVLAVVLLFLQLPTVIEARVPIEKWACGSGNQSDFSVQYSHSEVTKACPHFASELNHCCVVHDACYGARAGQTKCDEEFDECNLRVLEDERAHPCRAFQQFASLLLKVAGHEAYGASANYTGEASEAELPHLCRPEQPHGVFFDYLYTACPTIKLPISSCCDQLEHCPDSPLQRNRTECASRAMRCLAGARAMEPTEFNEGKCDRALNRTRRYMAADYILDGESAKVGGGGKKQRESSMQQGGLFVDSHQAFALLMFLSILCAVALLFTTYKYYRLRVESKDHRKYSTITLSAP